MSKQYLIQRINNYAPMMILVEDGNIVDILRAKPNVIREYQQIYHEKGYSRAYFCNGHLTAVKRYLDIEVNPDVELVSAVHIMDQLTIKLNPGEVDKIIKEYFSNGLTSRVALRDTGAGLVKAGEMYYCESPVYKDGESMVKIYADPTKNVCVGEVSEYDLGAELDEKAVRVCCCLE